jgi:hypothetical protein
LKPERGVRIYRNIFFSILILAAAAFGAFRWADALQRSLFTYQSPLSIVEIPPGRPMPAMAERVVVVLIGGLGYAESRATGMPNLESLVQVGASAPMLSRPPTFPAPAWTALLTGLEPELNNTPLMHAQPGGTRSLTMDSLFAASHDAGLQTAVAAFEGWELLLSADPPHASFYATTRDAVGDGQVGQAALGFIADSRYDLIFVYFGQLEEVGRASGVTSAAYRTAALEIDHHLRQIVRLVDLSDSVLVVASDHGLLEDGRTGGNEAELTELPLVVLGQAVVPGVYSPVQQVDLAPTIAALLGTRLPAAAHGRPLYEMLRQDNSALTQGQLQLAEQQVALAEAYLTAIQVEAGSQAAAQDLARAEEAWLGGNQAGALELARLVVEEARAEMSLAKKTRIAQERLPRLGIAAAGLVAAGIFLAARRKPTTLVSLLSGAAGAGVYYALYRLRGHTFSLSAVGDGETFAAALARDAAIGAAIGAALVLLGLFYSNERRWSAAMVAAYDYGLFSLFLAALPVLYGYWRNGMIIRWYLPDLGVILLHFMALVQLGVLALLALPLPWIIGFLVWGVGRWRSYSEARVQDWDPIARLRR